MSGRVVYKYSWTDLHQTCSKSDKTTLICNNINKTGNKNKLCRASRILKKNSDTYKHWPETPHMFGSYLTGDNIFFKLLSSSKIGCLQKYISHTTWYIFAQIVIPEIWLLYQFGWGWWEISPEDGKKYIIKYMQE